MVLHYAPPVPHRSSHRVTTDPQIGGDPLIGLSVVHRPHHDFPRLRAENVFVYGIGQVCFGIARAFTLLSKKNLQMMPVCGIMQSLKGKENEKKEISIGFCWLHFGDSVFGLGFQGIFFLFAVSGA